MQPRQETNYGRIPVYCVQRLAATFYSLNTVLGNLILFLSTSPPSTSPIPPPSPPPPPPVPDLEAGGQPEERNVDPQPPGPFSIAGAHRHVNNPPYHFDWRAMVTGFCLSSAVEIALQSLQPHIILPPLVHLLSLAMIFAFSSIFVSDFISPSFPNLANALILVARLSILTAFFFAITIPFSVSFKLISWSIFGLCLLVFVIYAAANGRVPHGSI